MTRAKALLIVVGNPQILQLDRSWMRFMQFCYANGGYKDSGLPLPRGFVQQNSGIPSIGREESFTGDENEADWNEGVVKRDE
jgi:hypothetical protein